MTVIDLLIFAICLTFGVYVITKVRYVSEAEEEIAELKELLAECDEALKENR